MKLLISTILLSAAISTQAAAQSLVDELCGVGHANEARDFSSVLPNPDGYYLPRLKTQLSHGDSRIVLAVGSNFHLCTRPASTPGMDATQAHTHSGKRVVKYLFVPTTRREADPNS